MDAFWHFRASTKAAMRPTYFGRIAFRKRSPGDLNLLFTLLVVLAIGGLVRFLPIWSSTYPLNDGGLFAHMASDLAKNRFLLPEFTTYNGGAIPFAYPPLGLYLTGILSLFVGGDTIAVVRWLPPALATASVLALYFLAAELLGSRWRAVVAAAAFATMPPSYMWLIVGGGVTRALGLVLALLALQQGVRMLHSHRPVHILTTALLSGLTLLSHPQAAVFLVVSLLTLLAFHVSQGRSASAVILLGLAGLGGLLVAGPWLLVVVANHGLQPILSAGSTALDPATGANQLLGLAFTDATVLDLMTAMGVLGIVVLIARGQWMIPVWLMLTVLIDPRAGTTYATVPLALAVVQIFGELVMRMIPTQSESTTLESEPMPRLAITHRGASILIILVLFVTLRTASRAAVDPASPLHGLAVDQVAAMGWVRSNVAEAATFAVVTGHAWESDYLSEWFPELAARTSLATVQGSEWTGIDPFLQRLAMYRQLQDCATGTATCLESWTVGWHLSGTYVFLPKGQLFGPSSPSDCCPALRETLRASAVYRVIYDGPGATIFAPAG